MQGVHGKEEGWEGGEQEEDREAGWIMPGGLQICDTSMCCLLTPFPGLIYLYRSTWFEPLILQAKVDPLLLTLGQGGEMSSFSKETASSQSSLVGWSIAHDGATASLHGKLELGCLSMESRIQDWAHGKYFLWAEEDVNLLNCIFGHKSLIGASHFQRYPWNLFLIWGRNRSLKILQQATATPWPIHPNALNECC